jgi:DNA-binding ferritin-like protein (Dps family)|tara:strand:- start:1095 stop:1499 length:405 start_codon:yes stop_codon:yes gene_type:complete
MGEDRMSRDKVLPDENEQKMLDSLEKDWYHEYNSVTKTFASSAIPTKKSKLTKQGWQIKWRDMVSLCSRALEYKDEAERRAEHLEDKLRTKQIAEATNEYKKMVKSFDELGEKYTKDMDALMKLLILLGRKIDE